MWSVFFRGVCLIHNVPITSTGDEGAGLFQVIWKCSGDVRSVSFSLWDVVQCIIRCLLVTHKQVLGLLLVSGTQKLFCGVESGCQKLSRMNWWIRCAGDMWQGRSVYVGRFPSLLPAETFLTCSLSCLTSSWSAGRQSLSRWGDGAQSGLTRGRHRGKDFVYLWAVSVLLEKRSVPFRWNFQGESFWVSQWPLCKHCYYVVLVANECLIQAFIFLLCFLSTWSSPRGVNIRPRFHRRKQADQLKVTKNYHRAPLSQHWTARMCSGTLFKRS